MKPASYIDSQVLISMIHKAATLLAEKQADLNSINVFPVADGDTGTNMAQTLQMVSRALQDSQNLDMPACAEIITRTALLHSRGNSGTALAQFLQGFCSCITHENLDSKTFVSALKSGSVAAKSAFLEPKKGTILDILDATYRAAEKEQKKDSPLDIILEKSLFSAQEALENTKNTLPQLQKAGVVDAGGAGLVIVLTGFLAAIRNEDIAINTDFEVSGVGYVEDTALTYKYCTEIVLKNCRLGQTALQDKLKTWGDSLQVVRNLDLVKIHIHTDQAEDLCKSLLSTGQIESYKAENMQEMQAEYLDSLNHHNNTENLGTSNTDSEFFARHKTLVITDSSADIPDYFFQRYPIRVLHLPLTTSSKPDTTTPNDQHLDLSEFYKQMESESETFIPQTSKINTHTFYNAFAEALNTAQKVICLPLSKGISATYESAVLAKKMLDEDSRIEIIDTQTSSSGLAVLIDYIFESLEKNLSWQEILTGLEVLRSKLQIYFIVEDVKYLERGGRITKTKAGVAKFLNIQPLLKLQSGKIEADRDRVFFSSESKKIQALFKKLKVYNAAKPVSQIYIVFAGEKAKLESEKLALKIEHQLGISKFIINILPLNPVVGAHSGPGTLGIIFV